MRGSVPGRATAEPQAPRRESKIDQLERITALREKGALTEEQYEAAKAEVLGA